PRTKWTSATSAAASAASRAGGFPSGTRVRRPHAGEPDVISVLRMHAVDAGVFVIAGAPLRGDGEGSGLVLRRPRNDAAGIVALDTMHSGTGRQQQSQPQDCQEQRPAFHAKAPPPDCRAVMLE